jgi:glycosyltransferase involved in cell wall biosynthesis
MTGDHMCVDGSPPRVSVVIPAHNEEQTIGRTLVALQQQDYADLEVIVVDDGSTDGTAHVVEGLGHAMLIRHAVPRGLSESYNTGIRAAGGAILATLHADCVPGNPEWVSRCIPHFADPDVGIVTTPFVAPQRGEVGTVEYLFMHALRGDRDASSLAGGPSRDVLFISGKCDFYRGSLLRELGGFRPVTAVAGEDKDLSLRVRERGFRIVMEPSVPVTHLYGSHQLGLLANWSKAIQYGEAARGVYRLHGRFHSRDVLANAGLLLGVLGGSVLSVVLRSWVPVTIAAAALLGKNVYKALPLLLALRRPLLYLAAIPVGAVDSLLMGYGVLRGPAGMEERLRGSESAKPSE